MNDERLGADLSTWMKEAELSPPDAVQSAREVAGGLPQTRQLGRWRWLPAFIGTRTDVKPMAQQTTAYQLTTMLATNGQAPTVSGRTRSMFSPAKAITATALAVAVGLLHIPHAPPRVSLRAHVHDVVNLEAERAVIER